MLPTYRNILTSQLLCCLPLLLFSQKPGQVNLVPNPGFEQFSDPPGAWYYSGKDFARVALYWTSPNASSPDLYAPNVSIPKSWRSKGFGSIRSFEGKSHVGITVYGCDGGKPHCKEYVQVQLSEPLVPGQRYGFSCMVAHMPKTVYVKNIELAFSEHELDEASHDVILLTPSLVLDRWIPSDGKWYQWTGHFVAVKPASFLLIGNFNPDNRSIIKMPWRSDLRYGYYFLDDVRLFKIPPIIKTVVPDSPLEDLVLEEGQIVSLGRIYFEHDRTDFMPQALIQLRQLLDFLKRHHSLRVEIRGHTDNVGTATYNQDLSERRAKAVVHWLSAKGIDPSRLVPSGYGSREPVSTNESAIGRSKNRRVEVKILSL